MRAPRDLTASQFRQKCDAAGFEGAFFGYYRLPAPYRNVSVCALNAGDRRRDQFAYLLRALAEEKSKASK